MNDYQAEYEPKEAVAILSNLTEVSIDDQELSQVVKSRLLPLLQSLYDEGKRIYHIGLTSRRDILAGEELVSFKGSHPDAKIILTEITLTPDFIKGFTQDDVEKYYKVADSSDQFIYHPVTYGEDINQQLNLDFSKQVSTIIAYGDCRSSTYMVNCDLDVRYLLTENEMWPDEVEPDLED